MVSPLMRWKSSVTCTGYCRNHFAQTASVAEIERKTKQKISRHETKEQLVDYVAKYKVITYCTHSSTFRQVSR